MNIALSAVLISILLIHPFIFNYSLYLSKATAIPQTAPLFEVLLRSAVLSLFLHTFIVALIPFEIRFDILLRLLGGDLKDMNKQVSNLAFHHFLFGFALYNLCLSAAMLLLGRLWRYTLLKTGWHLNPRWHLYDRWWYLFNGYYDGETDFDITYIDVVANTSKGATIYSGVLKDYEYTSEGLSSVIMGEVYKQPFLKSEDDTVSGLVQIPGNSFSIAYKDILNLNLRFFKIRHGIPGAETEVLNVLTQD